jgi:hypothetical protein
MMPMTAQLPRGSNLELFIRKQSAFKTPATGNYLRAPVYSYGVIETQPNIDDPLLGLTKTNSRDKTEAAKDLATCQGPIVAPLDFTYLRYWMEMVFGAPTTTGADGDFVHTFVSGGVSLPAATVERKMLKNGGSILFQTIGVMANTMQIQASRQGGYARVSMDCLAYGEAILGSTGAGTPEDLAVRDPIAAALGVYKIGGAAAEVLECNLTYSNDLQPIDAIGDARVSGFDLGDSGVTGTLRMRFRDTTLQAQAIAGTTHAGELLFQKSATRSLSWSMPIVRLEPAGIPNEGPGFIDQTFTLRAEQDASAAALTAVLKGGVETFGS